MTKLILAFKNVIKFVVVYVYFHVYKKNKIKLVGLPQNTNTDHKIILKEFDIFDQNIFEKNANFYAHQCRTQNSQVITYSD